MIEELLESDPEPIVTIWFDGSCAICTREIVLIRKLDRKGRLQFVDARYAAAANCPADRTDLLTRFHAEENGILLSGADAFGAMWRQIPLLRPLGLAARNRFLLALLERAYMAFLRIRPTLQGVIRRMENKADI